MGKNVVFTAKGCLASVYKRPFLMCILCFLMFMYRSSPVMFSLLVSASPIFVCTAVLLGALLSFGQPNVPETESKHPAALVKCGEPRVSNVGLIGAYHVDNNVWKRTDEPGQVIRGVTFSASKLGKGSLDGAAALVENHRVEIGKGEIRKVVRKLGKVRRRKKSKWHEGCDGEVMEKKYDALSHQKVDEHLESDYERSEADSFDSETVNVDSPPCSLWKKVENRDDDGGDEEDDDTLDSGSDRSESSSQDASMADIMPMLDELHPLLDEIASQTVQMSLQGSHAASEMSQLSCTSGNESDVEEDLDIIENDGDDDETQGETDDQAKSAITWTEEDQKNLQDLGSSEIERNQRLETLMQRRREQKYKSMVPEYTENSNRPFRIAPILTTRQNPFDAPNDAYDNLGLPPIPGSAPSVLLPSRNPFYISSDSSEVKPNIMGDGFQEKLTPLQPRDPYFRRREIIRVGPSVFATSRQEKQDVKLRPYFVPESGYSPFHQQLHEMSDSKLSSVPETTSVSSIEDTEDQRLTDEDNSKELEVNSSRAKVTENFPSGDQEPVSKREISEEEQEVISEHVGRGSQSSKEKSSQEFNDHKQASSAFEDHNKEGSVVQPEEVPGQKDLSSNKTEVSKVDAADDPDTSTRSTATRSPSAEVQQKDPVYDSSPPSVDKLHEPSMPHLDDKLKSSHGDTNKQEHGNIRSDSSEAAQRSDGKNSGHSDEEKHPTVTERECLTHVKVPSSDGQAEASNSIAREKIDASSNVDDDDVYHEASEKISTPSVGESTTTIFYNIAMNNLNAERLEEVQVPNTPVDFDKLRTVPSLNIPNIHELVDTRSNAGSPYTPDLTSMPSSASKEAGPHFNMQTILEEVSEAKEIDGMSESDDEGEIYWRPRPSAFNKYVDSVVESSSPDGGRFPDTGKPGSADGDETNVKEISSNGGSPMEPSTAQTSSNDRSAEVEKETLGLSVDGKASEERINRVDADKMDDGGKVPNSTTIVEVTGKSESWS